MQTASVDCVQNASLYLLSDSDKSTLLTGISIICSDRASGRVQPLSAGTLRVASENLQRCLSICAVTDLTLLAWFKAYCDEGLRAQQVPEHIDRELGYAAWSILLKDKQGKDRLPMNTLHYIYDALRHAPDLNERTLAEKVKLFKSASSLPIEDVLYYPRQYLQGEAGSYQKRPGNLLRVVEAINHPNFSCDKSDYLALSFNVMVRLYDQLDDPILKGKLSRVLDKVSRDYLALSFESAHTRLVNFVTEYPQVFDGYDMLRDRMLGFLTHPVIQVQEPSLDKNYTRRYFEKEFSAQVIQTYFDDSHWPALRRLINDVANSLFDAEVNTKEEGFFVLNNLTLNLADVPWSDADLMDLEKCLQYLTEDWMWGKTEQGGRDLVNLNARQKASVMALEEPAFRMRGLVYRDNAKRKIEITRDQQFGAMKYSRFTGPIRAHQPMPAVEQTDADIINSQIEICTYDRNRATYPHKNTRIPFVSSLSGHMVWQSVALASYLNDKKNKFSKAKLENIVNQLFLLTAALYNLEGYHSLHEVLDALELPSVKAHFADFGLSIDPLSLVDADLIREPLIAAGNYSQTQILREMVNRQIAG